jgi:hypothetical protein
MLDVRSPYLHAAVLAIQNWLVATFPASRIAAIENLLTKHKGPLGIGLALGVLAMMFLIFALAGRETARRQPPIVPAPVPLAVPDTQPAGDDKKQHSHGAFAPASAGLRRLSRTRVFEPPHESVDATAFRAGDLIVRVSAIEAPGEGAVCASEDQSLWACGRMARAAFYNLIRGKQVVCVLEAGERQIVAPEVVGHCSVDGKDLGREMITSGWARPLPLVTPDRGKLLEDAMVAKRGMWERGWKVARP